MRKSEKPTRIKPELVDVGDMIEVRWETDGVRYAVCAYVGARSHPIAGLDYEIVAPNMRTVLFRYTPSEGITFPARHAEIYRHRKAPDTLGVLL